MSLPSDHDSSGELYCEKCNFKKFTNPYEYKLHHLAHISEPVVSLVRLSQYSLKKLEENGYRLNDAPAKKKLNYVSPLKISLRKQKGTTKFQVVRKPKYRKKKVGNRKTTQEKAEDILNHASTSKAGSEANTAVKTKEEVEGNRPVERFGADNSKRRKSHPLPTSSTRESTPDNVTEKNVLVNGILSDSRCHGKVAERLSSAGVSVAKQRSTSSSTDGGTPPSKLNIFCDTNPDDSKCAKSEGEQQQESEKRIKYSKHSPSKRAGGLGYSAVPKRGSDIEDQPEGNESAEKENKLHKVQSPNDFDHSKAEFLNGVGLNKKTTKCESPCKKDIVPGKTLLENENLSPRSSGKAFVNGIEDSKDSLNFNGVQKKQARLKNSKVSKKRAEIEKGDYSKELDVDRSESKVASLFESSREEAVADSQTTAVRSSEAKGKEKAKKIGVNTTPVEHLQSEFMGPQTDRVSPGLSHSESQFVGADEAESLEPEENDDCSVLLDSAAEGQNDENSNFNGIGCNGCDDGSFQAESFAEGNNSAVEHNDEVEVAFSSLPSEDQSSLDPPQQSSLNEVSAANGESLNQNFLHTFLNESQGPQTSIQSDGSEFMPLDRLGQGLDNQPCQTNYDLNGGEASTPMEQLSQQVQRLPNPPQINVIPQHHMQPPQLHAGLAPLSTQQTGSFDTLNHLQPPLPPPLYQGYNMYNQNFSSQGPQQIPPRPPVLQQRPQIQRDPRSFQSIAPPPRQRQRSTYSLKRNSARMAGPQEVPPKQRRMEPPPPPPPPPPLAVRNPPPSLNPATKIPSGITVTPSKKNFEASKVANVLASRGITVTPSSGTVRQPSPSNRSQPRANPILNIGPGVSITANNGNRASSSFAVPGPRRNSPIVNPDVERPERCATVDLTQDDEPPASSRSNSRLTGVRFPCNQCSKVFPTAASLENHKASHRTAGALPFKCDKCTAQYPNASGLQQHKAVFHKAKQAAPDLAIPIVDLNHPGARDQLAKCGIHGFLPLSQLQSNGLGYFGVPIIHLDTAKEKAVSNLNALGAANILVLGKMKTLR